MPTTSSSPKPRTVGTGERLSTSSAPAPAAAAAASVGPPEAAARRIATCAGASRGSSARASCTREWNWMA